MIYVLKIKNLKIPSFLNFFLDVKRGLKFFFGRSYNYGLYYKYKKNNNNIFLDLFYNINKIYIYNRLKVLNYKNLLYKYRFKYRRYDKLYKIEGLSMFKSFLNNFIKFNGLLKKKKRIRRKKRIKMGRKKISNCFKPFFHFLFFFYLNKFSIVVDTYNKQNYNLLNIVKLYEEDKNKKSKEEKKEIDLNLIKYKFFYIFRYKSIKKFKKKKRYGYVYKNFSDINKNRKALSFLFFY